MIPQSEAFCLVLNGCFVSQCGRVITIDECWWPYRAHSYGLRTHLLWDHRSGETSTLAYLSERRKEIFMSKRSHGVIFKLPNPLLLAFNNQSSSTYRWLDYRFNVVEKTSLFSVMF